MNKGPDWGCEVVDRQSIVLKECIVTNRLEWDLIHCVKKTEDNNIYMLIEHLPQAMMRLVSIETKQQGEVRTHPFMKAGSLLGKSLAISARGPDFFSDE